MESSAKDAGTLRSLLQWRILVQIAAAIAIALISLHWGLTLRRAAWDFTYGAHFRGDVNNALYWGRQSADVGLFHLYDADASGQLEDPTRKIDYTPLRLGMANAWWHWVANHYPGVTTWQDDYDFTAPMIRANTAAELVSCLLIFLLIRLWRIREAGDRKGILTGFWHAMLGAILFWFSPAIIWDGHCWPQWDVWPIPFFLASVLLASLDCWTWAGVCLAIGASLKGQLLLAAPVMIVWPIARANFGNAFRILAGFAAATMLIALPWMNPPTAGWIWIVACSIAITCLIPFIWRIPLRVSRDAKRSAPPATNLSNFLQRKPILIPLLTALILVWPWRTSTPSLLLRTIPTLLIALLALARFLPPRLKPPAVALAVALLIFLLMPIFNASSNWFILGFEYGTEKFARMLTGNGAYNIARLFQVYYDWPRRPTDPVTIPFTAITLGYTQFSRILSFILVAICGIGAAIHDRQRDRRFLASMAAPWLLFFMVLTQMHGRYGIWAAGLSALLAGIDLGMAMLGFIVSLIGMIGMIENQLLFSRDWWPQLLQIIQQLDPGLGWVLLVASSVYLYCAVVPRPQRPTIHPAATDCGDLAVVK